MTRRKKPPPRPHGGRPTVEKPPRDPDAERAMLEAAVARFDPSAVEKLREWDAEEERARQGRARFAKRIARGDVEPEARLDLHGLDRQSATERLQAFLSSVRAEVVLVIHGRGQGILEGAARTELDRHRRVVEHLDAPPRLGGAGARIVRLRR